MTITLNHTIIPSRDKDAASRLFAGLFGLAKAESMHGFAAVRVNSGLTLLFDTAEAFETRHYAFHVSNAEFDATLARLHAAGLVYGSGPGSSDDGRLNDWGGVPARSPPLGVGHSEVPYPVSVRRRPVGRR